MINSPRSCGTCTARKVRCDRTKPNCLQCVNAGKVCDGYGVRLFWPRPNDTRRAIVAPSTNYDRAANCDGVEFIQTTVRDMELHSRLSGAIWNADEWEEDHVPVFPNPIRWIPYDLSPSEGDLLQYFESIAYSTLPTFGHDPTALRGTIIRAALLANTPSAVGVFQSLLAVSALHRYGLKPQAIQLQISALQALRRSSLPELTAQEAIQQIAATMLLCSFEIRINSQIKSNWAWFVCGSRKLVSIAVTKKLAAKESDFIVLQGWVHYHDVFARFSMRHWLGHGSPFENYSRDVGFPSLLSSICDTPEIPYPPGPSHEILHIFSVIVESVLEQYKPLYHSDAYRQHLRMLEWRLETMDLEEIDTESSIVASNCHTITELYQLASLIYLERCSGNLSTESNKIARWVERASVLLDKFETCNWPLFLFIFGLEARSDSQRLKILQLITKTETETHANNLGHAKAMVRMSWVQDDLGTSYVDYVEKMNMLLSSSNLMPTFI